jgi:hypothetical protein
VSQHHGLVRRGIDESSTYIRLDVLVLEVEGVLPDIDADDRDVGYVIRLGPIVVEYVKAGSIMVMACQGETQTH